MKENRGHFASPVAVVKATGELLGFIGYTNHQKNILKALDELTAVNMVPNGGRNGVTCEQATEFLSEKLSG
jgi:hypothetical protein